MGEEKEIKKSGNASKLVDFTGKILNLFENVPKAVAGIAIVISLVAGGTGAWGAYVQPDSADVKKLKQEVHDLQIWNEALRERTKSLIGGSNKIQFDGYMLDLDTGDIEKMKF